MTVKVNKTQVLLIIALFVILGLSYILDSGNRNISELSNKNNKESEVFITDSIEVNHDFNNGIHEYTGIINLPSPCYGFETEAVVRESYPEQVTMEFDIKAMQTFVACAQVITEVPFRIIFQASESAVVDAKVNGALVKLIVNKENGTE